jgi:hypothetical protein
MFSTNGTIFSADRLSPASSETAADGAELAARLLTHVDRLVADHGSFMERRMRGDAALRRLERQARVAALLARTLRDLAAAEEHDHRRMLDEDAANDEDACPRDPQELRAALASALDRQKIGKKSLTV